jgi:hypothetical protein
MVILGCCSSNMRSQAALGLLLSIHDLTPTLALSRSGWWLDPVDKACVSLLHCSVLGVFATPKVATPTSSSVLIATRVAIVVVDS